MDTIKCNKILHFSETDEDILQWLVIYCHEVYCNVTKVKSKYDANCIMEWLINYNSYNVR